MNDGNCDLLEASNNVLNRSKKDFRQLLNVYNIRDVRQIKAHTTEPLLIELENIIVELANYNWPDSHYTYLARTD